MGPTDSAALLQAEHDRLQGTLQARRSPALLAQGLLVGSLSALLGGVAALLAFEVPGASGPVPSGALSWVALGLAVVAVLRGAQGVALRGRELRDAERLRALRRELRLDEPGRWLPGELSGEASR